MAEAPNTADLTALHEQLVAVMHDTDALVSRLEEHLADSDRSWKSAQGHEFRSAWQNGFKPSLTKLCQSLAMAASDVAFEHNRMAEGSDEAAPDQLEPVRSPR